MAEMCKVTVGNIVKEYEENTSFEEIAKDFQKQYDGTIVLAVKNGKLTELFKKLTSDCNVDFYTMKSAPGIEAYKRSATLIMLKAFYDVVGKKNIEKISVKRFFP